MTSQFFDNQGLFVETDSPLAFLESVALIFNDDDTSIGDVSEIMIGDRPAAYAEGIFIKQKAIYMAIAGDNGGMAFIVAEAFADDLAGFEPLFIEVAATAHYQQADFADALPVITAENAAQLARYIDVVPANNNQLGQVEKVTFSADGSLVGSISFDAVFVGDATGDSEGTFYEDIRGSALAFSPDNDRVLVGDGLDGVFLLDLETGEISEINTEVGVYAVAYLPDGTAMIEGSSEGELRVRGAENGEIAASVQAIDSRITALAVNPDGTLLALNGSAGRVYLWNVSELRGTDSLQTDLIFDDSGERSAVGVAFSGDGALLAVLDSASGYSVFDVETGEIVLRGMTDASRASRASIALNQDGSVLAVANLSEADDTVKLIDVASGDVLARLSQGGDSVRAIAFSPDGTQLLAGGYYRDTLVLWAVAE